MACKGHITLFKNNEAAEVLSLNTFFDSYNIPIDIIIRTRNNEKFKSALLSCVSQNISNVYTMVKFQFCSLWGLY